MRRSRRLFRSKTIVHRAPSFLVAVHPSARHADLARTRGAGFRTGPRPTASPSGSPATATARLRKPFPNEGEGGLDCQGDSKRDPGLRR